MTLKEDINKALHKLKASEGNVRSVTTMWNNLGTLIEVDSDALANWSADTINRAELCSLLGDGITFKPRTYNVMTFNVPLNMEPENLTHRLEVNEVNGWSDRTVLAIKWAKPIKRRSPHQRTAHLILMFTNPEAANRAISSGVSICNKRCEAERVRKEPM